MNLLSEINRKVALLGGYAAQPGIEAVVRHIQHAERHLSEGRASGNDEAFNDVVYRANQAFEGALKEAFLLLTNSATTNLPTHEIEQHLLRKNVLMPRVAGLLTNYRRQWRNPSTHDHKLIFRDQEAFLAIVSVSAFVSVLVDQMVEVFNQRRESEETDRRHREIQFFLGEYNLLPFDEQVVRLLLAFAKTSLLATARLSVTETEILGRLTGFLSSVDPAIEIRREPLAVPGEARAEPDLLLIKNNVTVVIELARFLHRHEATIQQVAAYLLAGNWSAGVIFIPPFDRVAAELRTLEEDRTLAGRTVRIHTVYAAQDIPIDRLYGTE